MVRFVRHDRPRPRNYFSRREQWRLMLLILPLGLVIIVMMRLRDPIVAQRIDHFFGAMAEQPDAAAAKSDDERTVQPGEFRSATKDTPSETPPAPQKNATKPTGLFPGVQPEWLAAIRDSSYFRNAEKDAWFGFFSALSRMPEEQLKSAHSIEADYIQLVDQPDFYRGKLVTVYGYVRQVTEQTPAPNDLGIEKYYRVVVQPTDGSYWPIFVYCLKLPPDLELGENAAGGNMKVNGLFFKKLSYPWKNGLGTAPVIVATTIDYHGVAPGGPGLADIHPPTAADAWKKSEHLDDAGAQSKQTQPNASFRDLLAIAGWDVSRLAALDDGQPLANEQRSQALELLRRLRTFRSGNLEDWAHDGLDAHTVLSKPDDFRGQLVQIAGRVKRVVRRGLEPADAERLEMPAYYECELDLEKSAGPATLITARVPEAWLRSEVFNEPASAVAIYLKQAAANGDHAAIWLAKEIAWHPGKSADADGPLGPGVSELFYDKPDKTLGRAVLGAIGMDVGLLDQVQSRGEIRADERDAFYQLLRCMNDVNDSQLVRFAQNNLPLVRKEWERELQAANTAAAKNLAKEVISRADDGRYSVAPLFNDPGRQIGRLFVFDGAARRCLRVEVGPRSKDGTPIDAAGNHGIDHYYELQVFTDDSQNYPLVFCVRELPDGFPTGTIHVPVRMAGFFFKDWSYRPRGGDDGDDVPAPARSKQVAPLLIGRAPIVLEMPQGGAGLGQYMAGGIFVLALAGICAAALIYTRGDRRFRRRVIAEHFSPPPGQSLNELKISDADGLAGAERSDPPAALGTPFGRPLPPELGDGNSAQLQ